MSKPNVSFRPPTEVFDAAKARAEERGQTMTDYLVSLMLDYLRAGGEAETEVRLAALEAEIQRMRKGVADGLALLLLNLTDFPKEEVEAFFDERLR